MTRSSQEELRQRRLTNLGLDGRRRTPSKGRRSAGGGPTPKGKRRWCTHAMELRDCPVCGDRPRVVFITGGGSSFHLDRNCSALAKGQDNVSRRGGIPTQIDAVGPRLARAVEFRNPCKTCVVKPSQPKDSAQATRTMAKPKKSRPRQKRRARTAGKAAPREPASQLERLKAEAQRRGVSLRELVTTTTDTKAR